MISFTGIFEGSFHSAPSEQMVMSNRIPRTGTYEYGKPGGLNPNLAIQSSYAACSRPSSGNCRICCLLLRLTMLPQCAVVSV